MLCFLVKQFIAQSFHLISRSSRLLFSVVFFGGFRNVDGRQLSAAGLNRIRLCSHKAERKESEFMGKNQLLVCEYKLKPACLSVYLRDELYCDWQMDQQPK